LLLTLAIAGSYFAARAVLKPACFGQYGWYRGDALTEIASHPTSYAGMKACEECHEVVVEKKAKSKHQFVSCESCHGPNAEHADNPTTETKKITDPKFCLRCHEANLTKPAKFPQIDPKEHYSDSKCGECHLPHAPSESPSK
jgi:hypothetical protein